jgi:hypothetical protein
VILGQRGGPDSEVRAGIEELDGGPPLARGPDQRNAEETDGRPTAVPPQVFSEAERGVRRSQRVVSLERSEIAHEVDVAVALDVDQRPNERVVRMEAARQDER